MLTVLVLVALVAQATADIHGTNPSTGSCICAAGTGINVRSSACGTVIGQISNGQCFPYQGSKSTCSVRGVSYDFFQLKYGSGSGWVAGRYLAQGSSSQCSQQPASGGGCPRIVSRAEWGARPPTSTQAIRLPIPRVFIHHTESGACRTQADCSRLVRSFQNYHQQTLKWADIGYNFLVGEDGNVYEGRGWDRVGAHARQWNPSSLGISVIGSFKSTVPNAAALNAVKQLIACGISKGKVSRTYSLHGHRDGVCTDCPGNAFYNLIKTWPRYAGKLPGSC